MIGKNVRLGKPLKLSSWRKVAVGTWRTAGDPSVYGIQELDVARALAYIESAKAASGARVTMTHFVGRAVAETLRRHPEINCIARFGRLYPRQGVDIFYQVANDAGGADLSGTTIRDADQKSVAEIAREMAERVSRIRTQGDPSFRKMKKIMGAMPGFMASWILNASGFIMYALNLWSPALGTPRDPFGSAMVTNVGSLGLDVAFAPLVPYSRVPLLIAVGRVSQVPVVENGQIVVSDRIKLCVTFDHRLIDGMHASKMAATMQKIFANPEIELGAA